MIDAILAVGGYLRRLRLWLRRRKVAARHTVALEAQLIEARQHEACERARAERYLGELADVRPELAALRRLHQRMLDAQSAYERAMTQQQEAR